MEGKALFYAQLVGVSAVPILIDTKDVDEFVDTVIRVAPGLRRDPPRGHLRARVLRDRAPAHRGPAPAGDARRRPRHRGRHHGGRDRGLPPGRACAWTRRSSARSASARPATGSPRSSTTPASSGSSPPTPAHGPRSRRARTGSRSRDLATVMGEADVVVATTGRPGLITPELVRPGQVILALTNPAPEIEPELALAGRRRLRRRRHQRQQRPRLPGHLPGRAAGRRQRDQHQHEARRRLGAGRADRRVRARARRARPQRARDGGPGGTPGRRSTAASRTRAGSIPEL